MDPSSRIREWLPSVLILRGLCHRRTSLNSEKRQSIVISSTPAVRSHIIYRTRPHVSKSGAVETVDDQYLKSAGGRDHVGRCRTYY